MMFGFRPRPPGPPAFGPPDTTAAPAGLEAAEEFALAATPAVPAGVFEVVCGVPAVPRPPRATNPRDPARV